MNKVERLAVAGAIAPAIRAQGCGDRRVARVDKDGNVVGYTTLAEVQRAVLERGRIELELADGVRPKRSICRHCGRLIVVGPLGGIPVLCPSGCECSEPGCTRRITANGARKAVRAGRAAKCKSCSQREIRANESDEERAERHRKGIARRTAEERADAMRGRRAAEAVERSLSAARAAVQATTNEKVARIHELLEQGMSITETAHALSIPRHTVWRLSKRVVST